jgi:hypothetical protein
MFSGDQLKNALLEAQQDQTNTNVTRDSQLAAAIRYDKDGRPRWASRVTIDLTTAMSFKDLASSQIMQEPFDSFDIETATDDNVSIKMSFGSNELYHSVNYKTLKKSDVMSFERTVKGCAFEWAAQSGKSITIVFYLGARFQSGSFRQVLSGGVVVTTGSAMTPQPYVDVLVTATQIFASDTTRNNATIQNLGTSDIYISGVNTVTIGTGATPGIKLEPNDSYEWKNTGACYGIADGATSRVSLNTE